MNETIRLLRSDNDTVTLSRRDYEALLDALEDARDRASLRDFDARVASVGLAAVIADALPSEAVERLMSGESPVRIWRERRGLTQRVLAEQAEVPVSYLSEIETGKKPGSLAAMLRIARALRLDVEELAPWDERQ
jgi:DNA-binding XRE family transcriptional regulator